MPSVSWCTFFVKFLMGVWYMNPINLTRYWICSGMKNGTLWSLRRRVILDSIMSGAIGGLFSCGRTRCWQRWHLCKWQMGRDLIKMSCISFYLLYFLTFVNSYYDLDDQSVFWIQIRNSSIPSIVPMLTCADYNGTRSGNDLTACPLDGCMFSAGGLRGIAYDWIRENLGK